MAGPRAPLLFGFPDDLALTQRLVEHLDGELGELHWHLFPDRESLVTLRTNCAARDVAIVCSLTQPDAKSLPLYFAAHTARELGARSVGLIAPYLGYMRQDERFAAGQAISAVSYARLLSTWFDWLVTVDPHLHRIKALDSIFSMPATAVSAMPVIGEWVRANIRNPVIIGPDHESAQWVRCVAEVVGAPWVALEKVRRGDRDVSVEAVDPALVRGRSPILVDDIASSGNTLAQALKGVTGHGCDAITCAVVHALFADDAEQLVRSAGAQRIVSTNTVVHATNAIDITPVVATAVQAHIRS